MIGLLQVRQMINMQCDLNEQSAGRDWKKGHLDWHTAIWIECAELMGHYGWKWWQNKTTNIKQLQLEVVDIWHFGVSDLLQSHSPAKLTVLLHEALHDLTLAEVGPDIKDYVEQLAHYAITHHRFDLQAFMHLMYASELTPDSLYKYYVGKNILNTFRQSNGYKTGEYIKIWAGKEDNEHLYSLVESLPVDDKFIQLLEYGLATTYAEVLAAGRG